MQKKEQIDLLFLLHLLILQYFYSADMFLCLLVIRNPDGKDTSRILLLLADPFPESKIIFSCFDLPDCFFR